MGFFGFRKWAFEQDKKVRLPSINRLHSFPLPYYPSGNRYAGRSVESVPLSIGPSVLLLFYSLSAIKLLFLGQVPSSRFCRLLLKFSCWCLCDNQSGNAIFDAIESWRVEAEMVRILFWMILFVLYFFCQSFIYPVGSCCNYDWALFILLVDWFCSSSLDNILFFIYAIIMLYQDVLFFSYYGQSIFYFLS